jgi:glutathione synthase
MTVRVGIIMDPIAQIAFKKDSSLAMLLAAQARSWTIYYMEQRDLYQLGGEARARMRPIKVFNDPQHWYETGDETDSALAELDVILMRKDPPFNSEYVYATYLLELAEQAGTLVVNRPQSLRDCNEKFFATQFPQCTPPTLVSRRSDILREFARDTEIAAIVGPELRKRGLLFVGLDVIGDYLTEINITSPTCIREIDNAFDTRIGERLMDAIAGKLKR